MPLSVPAVLTANVVAGWGAEGRRWLDALPEASVRLSELRRDIDRW
jgi:hypothetical protein